MARSFLTDARLPKRFWFWAVKEAFRRINMLPVKQVGTDDLSTPHELFFGEQPDYRTLFPFGCVGAFRRPRDGNRSRTTFESQSCLGIALGRSDFTAGLVFWIPGLQSFSVSPDYRLDNQRDLRDAFPELIYDGGLDATLFSAGRREDAPTKHVVGDTVFIRENEDILEGTVAATPTRLSNWYSINVEGHEDPFHIDEEDVFRSDEYIGGTDVPELTPATPSWMTQDAKITLLRDDTFRRGFLHLDSDNDWEFVRRDGTGRIVDSFPLPDLPLTWRYRMVEGSLSLGWQENVALRAVGTARHVSATGLKNPHNAPASVDAAVNPDNPDHLIWTASYDEEYEGLDEQNTFEIIDERQYKQILSKHGKAAEAIPSMAIFTVKPDEDGNPVRAKSRIVVLGNLEHRVWEKSDKYAPVLSGIGARVLASVAVSRGRMLKQGDCKNAFCHPTLPEDKITIVRPPKGCPRSKPGTYWRLRKTLYGLARSPRHWFQAFSSVLDNLGFKPLPHEPCIFKATPIPGLPPIYLGTYVDDFTYFSESDEVEAWFESQLGARLRVDFMGALTYYLGCYYHWSRDASGKLCLHISQEGYLKQLLDRFGMQDSIPADTPYRSGLVIDRIPHDGVPPQNKAKLITKYQSLLGGLNWMAICTRPDISVAMSLLSQFCCDPSAGHLEGAKYVLRYLKGTADYGIYYRESSDFLAGHIAWPHDHSDASDVDCFTDSNWGPQDASQPVPDDTRTVSRDEVKSLQGVYITRMGGPISWKVMREKRVSRSSCEAEVKAMDEGTRDTQFIRHLLTELGELDPEKPTPLFNDNKGAIDWSGTGNVTNKRMRHINIREIAVLDAQEAKEVKYFHVPGKVNPSDLFTKEIKDKEHFRQLRSLMVLPRHHGGC
jgi:hypothetical protein